MVNKTRIKHVLPDAYARRLVNKLDAASQDYAFMGSQHPNDWEGIKANHRNARKQLLRYIDNLQLDIMTLREGILPE